MPPAAGKPGSSRYDMSDPQENRLYRFAADLPDALWDDLAARPPAEAAVACQARLEQTDRGPLEEARP